MFLTKSGDMVADRPNPDDYVELTGTEQKLEEEYSVWVYRKSHADAPPAMNPMDRFTMIAVETFWKEPTPEQIKWCLLRHNGDFAEVHRLHFLSDLPF